MECRFIQGVDGMQVWIGFGWDTVLTRVWVGCRLSKCPTLAEAMLGNKRLQLKGLQEVSPGSCQMHLFHPVQQKTQSGRAHFGSCQKSQCRDQARMAHGSDSRVTHDVHFQPLCGFRPLRGQTATPEIPVHAAMTQGPKPMDCQWERGSNLHPQSCKSGSDVGNSGEEEQRCAGSLSSN